ncbi:1-phosphofructokinase family hexose kinase [Streptomyces sp. NPDC006733]|uniref:1-phosphofructokinase family hexose kinase n=1 Tax=Streptomyces sp. NPDC006733 TaxID=3155460 RepID=UPI0033DD3EE1
MILTVTLNAALDVTYVVDELVPRTSHRVDSVHERAGGKGVNVARVLSALGWQTAVTGLCGGDTGDRLRAELRTAGPRDELVPVTGESRRTLTVVSRADGDATVFNQGGPAVTAGEWEAFTARYARLLGDADVAVLSGSLPPGLPVDVYAHLVTLAREAGVRTILDTSGSALRAGLAAGPDVVKPNADELLDLTGLRDLAAAAAAVRALGARDVVASHGPDGLHALTAQGTWRAAPPERLAGNPTGAGDACVAALAAGLATGAPWPAVLGEAVALSAAAVLRPTAGDFDADAYHRFRTAVSVEEVHAARSHP